MSHEFKLQDPGEGIHEVTIVAVKVSGGETVDEGDILIEIETDKATVEIPSPFSGVIKSIDVSKGDEVRVGERILSYDSDTEEDQDENRRSSDEKQKRRPVAATPVARRIARDQEIELEDVRGTGTSGRVTGEDVRAAAGMTSKAEKEKKDSGKGEEQDSALPDFEQWGSVERIPLRGVRRAVARTMTRAWSQIPHVTHHDIADITDLERFRKKHKKRIESQGGRLTLTPIVLKALASVLREFPRFNASLDTGSNEIVIKDYYHLGVAVQTERGLVVPVIRNVDRKSIAELAAELPLLVERVRRNDFARSDLEGGTFTLTNPGPVDGGIAFTPIIRPPEAAILGLGRARLEPVVTGDLESYEVKARLRLPVSLAFDHRLNDGADAGRFVSRFIEVLTAPERLALNA